MGPDSCCGVSQGVERGNGKSESIQFCRVLTESFLKNKTIFEIIFFKNDFEINFFFKNDFEIVLK